MVSGKEDVYAAGCGRRSYRLDALWGNYIGWIGRRCRTTEDILTLGKLF